MHGGSENPVVRGTATVTEALFIITDKGLGAVSVVDENDIMVISAGACPKVWIS